MCVCVGGVFHNTGLCLHFVVAFIHNCEREGKIQNRNCKYKGRPTKCLRSINGH